MAKDIFSKIIKDYNNELEMILEKKAFSEDAKNLLLSMLYKIENAYEDYKKVKVNVCSKNQFVKEILDTVQNRCNQIEFVSLASKEGQELYAKNQNCIIDKESETIRTFQNEKSILEALISLRQKDIKLKPKYELISSPLEELLTVGNNMNSVEAIVDFNGWSWDISNKKLKDGDYNVIYQMLVILLGNEIIDKWVNDRKSQQEDYTKVPNNMILGSKYNESYGITQEEIDDDLEDNIQEISKYFESIYGEKLQGQFFEQLKKYIIFLGVKYNSEYREKILESLSELKEELEKMTDKKQYLDELSNTKTKLTEEIKQIDTILSNENNLKEEYTKRNSKLKNEDKIFSVSHLRLMLEKERKQELERIKDINKIMEPLEFVNIKNKLEVEIKYYTDLQVEKPTKEVQKELLKQLKVLFCKCMQIKLENATDKKQIEDIIYEIRYYEAVSGGKEFDKLEEKIIEKACENKVLETFSEDKKLNYKILKNIFKTKIIDLNTIVYVLKYNKGILTIKIYDGKIQDSTEEIKITEKVELQVKLNKKIKIWQ